MVDNISLMSQGFLKYESKSFVVVGLLHRCCSSFVICASADPISRVISRAFLLFSQPFDCNNRAVVVTIRRKGRRNHSGENAIQEEFGYIDVSHQCAFWWIPGEKKKKRQQATPVKKAAPCI
jgi:hypothetical protein